MTVADVGAGNGEFAVELARRVGEHGLVIACVTNGMPDNRKHRQRFSQIATAVYVDLGLVDENDPGRDRQMPQTGLT